MMKLTKHIDVDKVLERVCRYYVFFFLNVYGMGKIMGGQFYRKGQLPEEVASMPIGSASAYDLAWSFMGYSFMYILFIGVSQIIGAWLLLWNRTKILGVMILTPIMMNIIVFDIIFLDIKDALVNASLYFIMLLYILWYNKDKVVKAFKALTSMDITENENSMNRIAHWISLIVIAALIFVIDQFFVNMIRDIS